MTTLFPSTTKLFFLRRSSPVAGRSSIMRAAMMMGRLSSSSSCSITGSSRSHPIWRRMTTTRAFATTTTAASSASDDYSYNNSSQFSSSWWLWLLAGGTAAAAGATTLVVAATTAATTLCDEASETSQQQQQHQLLTPSNVAKEDFQQVQESHDPVESLPVYTMEQVAKHNGEQNDKSVWMSYGGIVYDVTDFLPNHPGGTEKILQAAGTAMEPYWFHYRQHFASDLPMRLMEHMAIGQLSDKDQSDIDEQMEILEQDDPYAREPVRSPALRIHSDTPMNAELPTHLLTKSYLTPNELFYIRHHHPVPFYGSDVAKFRLSVGIINNNNNTADDGASKNQQKKTKTNMKKKLTLDNLKKLPKVEITATIMCSGNRRGGMNTHMRTSGTPWGQGALSTARFTGVRLRDVLEHAGLVDDLVRAQDELGLEHVRFYGADGMSASIPIEKALNPYGDVIVAYEMNGEPLPRDHGFPLRVIVPGYNAVRSVKWLEKIELSDEEAEGPWQRGLNYKNLPPGVTDAAEVDLRKMPSMMEASVNSGITKIERVDNYRLNPGDSTTIRVGGWAWAGGGRNVVRVDLTGNNGKTWTAATLKEGSEQRYGRAWAWTFWEVDLPVVVQEDGTVHVASKAVDMAFNVQPESSAHSWNVRGLGNSSWYRAHANMLE